MFSRRSFPSLLASALALFLNTTATAAVAATMTTPTTTTIAAVWLVDAQSGEDLLQLSSSAPDGVVNTINLQDLSTNALTVRADVLQDSAHSCLLFDWNGGEFQRTASEAPYYMGGGGGGDNGTAKIKKVKALTQTSNGEAGVVHTLTVSAADCQRDAPLSRGHGKPVTENSATENTDPLPRIEDNENNNNATDVDYAYEAVEDPFLPAAPQTSNYPSGQQQQQDDDSDHDRRRARRNLSLPSLLTTTDSAAAAAPSDSLTFQIEIVDRAAVGAGAAAGATLPHTDVPDYDADIYGALNGEAVQYAKLTLGFAGPLASEAGMTIPHTSESQAFRRPSTFMDYRLDVLFVHEETETQYLVPGYYAGRGSASSQNRAGNVWLCHFRPLLPGTYTWRSEFVEGTGVAASPNGGGNPAGHFHSVQGSFEVAAAPEDARGMLAYVGQHQLQYLNNGEYFVARPATGLPNLLASSEFDGTETGSDLKQYRSLYRGEPFTWNDGRGKAVLGAVNHAVQQQQANTLSVKLFDEDSGVTPFRIDNNYVDYDLSKLAQWEALFDYCDRRGLALNLQLGAIVDTLDANESALYLREMVARFGHHLAVVWDLEAAAVDTPDALIATSQRLKKIDPYRSPVMAHAPDDDLEPLLGAKTIDGVHLASPSPDTDWETQSDDAGHAWVVRVVENERRQLRLRLRGAGHR